MTTEIPEVTVCICTKDRRSDLRRAVASASAQEGAVEVLVVDDGSSDGSREMVREEFPGVRVERFETSAGLIARRNDAAQLARAPIVLHLDDDAEFTSPHVAAGTAADFSHPRVGAVAVPYVEVGLGETQLRQRAPDDERVWATGRFIGTAHALRLDVFARVGGFRADFVRQTEELDYSVRMLGAGYIVRLGRAEAIHHHQSPRRSMPHIVEYDCRNELLHAFLNVPLPYAAARAGKALAYSAVRVPVLTGQPRAAARGIRRGIADAVRMRAQRRPVSRRAYALSHRLRHHGPLALEEIEAELPPLPA